MAQIFIAHSSKDGNLVNFFKECFYRTKVEPVFEEIERIIKGEITTSDVQADIDKSNALFAILTENVERIQHTRDWVVWEAGISGKKAVWAFEPYSQYSRISVVIPNTRHYVIFETNDEWLRYVNSIVRSYDDSHILPTLLVSGGIGGVLGGVPGAVIGGVLGGALGSSSTPARPLGIEVSCDNCSSVYNVHIPEGLSIFRCPVCNVYLEIGT